MIGFNMGRFVLLVYMYTRSELYLRFDSSGTENRDFTGKNVVHGFHGSPVDFTGLPQKQPISRTRDTVKKEGPCFRALPLGLTKGLALTFVVMIRPCYRTPSQRGIIEGSY